MDALLVVGSILLIVLCCLFTVDKLIRWRILPVVALLAFAVPCRAQLPEMPQPKPQAKFWDTHAKIAATSTVVMLALDSGVTCNALANGRHEDWGPQSCRNSVLFMSAYRVGFWTAAYFAHRHHLRKLERVFEWAGPAINLAGVSYSAKNGGL